MRIDTLARRVFSGDAEIEVTSREFDVLQFLTRHPGEVLSKRDILNGAWELAWMIRAQSPTRADRRQAR